MVPRFGMLGYEAGECVIPGIEGWKVGSERHAGGTSQGSKIEHQIGLLFVAQCQRVGEDQPSLGIGVPISTVRPLRLRKTSPGRKALPEIAFSTAGTSTLSRTGRRAFMMSPAS